MIKVIIIKPTKTTKSIDVYYDVGMKSMVDIKNKIESKIKDMKCLQHPNNESTITLSFNGNVVATTKGCCDNFEKEIVSVIKF